ncbi:MAG: LLM class flavin-dependent oxidoreductase [bacterium]
MAVPPQPRVLVVLSENWTLTSARDLPDLVRMAQEAEQAGVDGVMVSQHIVLGPSAGAAGPMANPRQYAMPGNQDPAMPWPSSLLLLAAVAARTSTLRLVAGAIIAPLQHPLILAKDLATLDLLSAGRLVVLPTVSWHEEEYAALGVPYRQRGARLDEHLAVWRAAWSGAPVSNPGPHYRFDTVYVQPSPHRPGGPPLWFGSSGMHPALLRRLVEYGSGWNPLGAPTAADRERLATAMVAAGRSVHELELVGGTRAVFASTDRPADFDEAFAAIPDQLAAGFATFCVKPSQLTDDRSAWGATCRRAVQRIESLTG